MSASVSLTHELKEEFAASELVCPPVPRRYAAFGELTPEEAELLANDLKLASKRASEELDAGDDARYAIDTLRCRLGMDRMPFEEYPRCYPETRLVQRIQSLDYYEGLEELLSVVEYMNSLGIDGTPGAEYPRFRYLGEYLDSVAGENPRAPSFSCLARNYYAAKVLDISLDLLSESLLFNLDIADGILMQLPEHQRPDVIREALVRMLGWMENLDPGELELFYGSLCAQNRLSFAEALSYIYPEDRSAIAHAEYLHENALDSELRRLMGLKLEEWRELFSGHGLHGGERE